MEMTESNAFTQKKTTKLHTKKQAPNKVFNTSCYFYPSHIESLEGMVKKLEDELDRPISQSVVIRAAVAYFDQAVSKEVGKDSKAWANIKMAILESL